MGSLKLALLLTFLLLKGSHCRRYATTTTTTSTTISSHVGITASPNPGSTESVHAPVVTTTEEIVFVSVFDNISFFSTDVTSSRKDPGSTSTSTAERSSVVRMTTSLKAAPSRLLPNPASTSKTMTVSTNVRSEFNTTGGSKASPTVEGASPLPILEPFMPIKTEHSSSTVESMTSSSAVESMASSSTRESMASSSTVESMASSSTVESMASSSTRESMASSSTVESMASSSTVESMASSSTRESMASSSTVESMASSSTVESMASSSTRESMASSSTVESMASSSTVESMALSATVESMASSRTVKLMASPTAEGQKQGTELPPTIPAYLVPLLLVIGSVVVVLMVMIFAFIVFVVLKRKRRQKMEYRVNSQRRFRSIEAVTYSPTDPDKVTPLRYQIVVKPRISSLDTALALRLAESNTETVKNFQFTPEVFAPKTMSSTENSQDAYELIDIQYNSTPKSGRRLDSDIKTDLSQALASEHSSPVHSNQDSTAITTVLHENDSNAVKESSTYEFYPYSEVIASPSSPKLVEEQDKSKDKPPPVAPYKGSFLTKMSSKDDTNENYDDEDEKETDFFSENYPYSEVVKSPKSPKLQEIPESEGADSLPPPITPYMGDSDLMNEITDSYDIPGMGKSQVSALVIEFKDAYSSDDTSSDEGQASQNPIKASLTDMFKLDYTGGASEP